MIQVKSPLSRHNDLRRRIGFDTTDVADVNSISESDSRYFISSFFINFVMLLK